MGNYQKNYFYKKRKGSFTVELTLIFPTIFLSILAIMYASIIHYQNIVNAGTAMRSAARISAYWQYIGDADLGILEGRKRLGTAHFQKHDPYRVLIDTNYYNRLSAGQNYADKLVGQNPSFHTSARPAIKVKVGGNFLFPNIEVEATKQYINPLGKTFEQFGIKTSEQRSVKAVAPLTNSTEFVRNIDFIREQKNKK